MFRRGRPIRPRPPVRPGMRRPLPAPVVEAERLMRSGEWTLAARRFHELAAQAQDRGRPVAAGELYLRAARCYLEIQDVDQADDCAEAAIGLFIRTRRLDRVRQVLPRVLSAMERRGRQEDAQRLRAQVEQRVVGLSINRPGTHSGHRLPDKCPNCGAPLLSSEVAWDDPLSAICPYCGGVVKAESAQL